MKILITGGAGFLGINLVRYLHSRENEIVSLDIVGFDYPDMNNVMRIINQILIVILMSLMVGCASTSKAPQE